jgi:hypothetical protein
LLLLGCGVVLLLVCAIASGVGLVLYLQRTQTKPVVYPVWQDPLQAENLVIAPTLSITSLAGAPDLPTINALLARDETDSAYATAVYATEVTDRQRLGALLLIGGKYTEARNTAQAQLAYQAARDLAVLSPSLSDFERTEGLAQIAAALYKLKNANDAGLTLSAAKDIVLASPFLKDAHRFVLLNKMILSAQQGNDTARIKELNDERAKFVASSEANAPPPSEPPDPLPAVEALPKNDTINAQRQKRVTAALKIAQLGRGATIPDAALLELEDALVAEDAVRMKVYNAPTDKLPLAQKAALVRARIEWLSLKYRVARRAFGASLMPDWEDKVDEIRSQLAKAYEDFYSLRSEQAVTLPKTKDIELAESFLLRRHILAGRLGLYPNFPEEDFVDKLNDSTDKLIANQPHTSLRLKVEGAVDRFFYHLVDDDTWNGGAPSSSPPPRTVNTPTPQPSLAPTRAATSTVPVTNATPATTPARGAQPTPPTQANPQPTSVSAPTNPQPTSTTAPPVQPTNTPAPTATATPLPRNTPTSAPPTATPKPYP